MSRLSAALLAVGTFAAITILECSRSGGQLQSFAPRFTVLPRSAKVFVGQSLQFRTTLVGGAHPAVVTWSVVGPGSIDQSGLYRAADAPSTAEVVADAGGAITDSTSVATVKPPSSTRPRLLSTCYEDGTVNVYDAKSGLALDGAFTVGGHAAGLAVDPARALAVFAVDAEVIAVDLASMRWWSSAPIPDARLSEVATLAFGYFAATDNLAEPGTPGVRIFRVNRNHQPILVSSARAGETPEGIATADGGRTFYVTAINSNTVMRFALDHNGFARRTGVATTATRPFGVAVDEAHHLLLVADNDTPTLNGTRANPGLEQFSLPAMKRIGSVLPTGSKASLPLGLAVDPSISRLFVTNEGLANVVVFSLPTLHRIATLRTALTPWIPYLDARRHRLYVPNARADSISVFDTRSLRPAGASVQTCSYPTSVAVFDPKQTERSVAAFPGGQ